MPSIYEQLVAAAKRAAGIEAEPTYDTPDSVVKRDLNAIPMAHQDQEYRPKWVGQQDREISWTPPGIFNEEADEAAARRAEYMANEAEQMRSQGSRERQAIVNHRLATVRKGLAPEDLEALRQQLNAEAAQRQ